MTPLLVPGLRSDRGFERIYHRHAGDVYRYALAMLHNRADAEDVTQTTFLNAFRAYQRGERPRAPQNWLITIAHNVCRQRFRQSERRVREVMLNEDVAATLVKDDDAPTIQDVRRALVHLPFNQRSALVMRELEGRSYAEIAQALELSLSAVETLLFRARRTLREQLEGALTCREAELALSQQLDGRLARSDRGPLRAHLRECKECATLARKQRAQSAAIKALGAVPLPPSLASLGSLFGGGAAGGTVAVGGGLALKAAAVVTAGVVVAGAGYEGARRAPWLSAERNGSPPTVAEAQLQKAAARAAAPSPTRRLGVARRPSLVARVRNAGSEPQQGGRVAVSKVAAVSKAEKPAKAAKRGPAPAVPVRGRGAQAPSAESRRSAQPSAYAQVFHVTARPPKKDKERDEKQAKVAKEKDKEKDKSTHEDKDPKEKKEKKEKVEKAEAKALPRGVVGVEDDLPPADKHPKDEDKTKEAQGPDPGKKNDPPKEPGPPPAAPVPPPPSEPPPPSDPPGDGGKDKK